MGMVPFGWSARKAPGGVARASLFCARYGMLEIMRIDPYAKDLYQRAMVILSWLDCRRQRSSSSSNSSPDGVNSMPDPMLRRADYGWGAAGRV